MIKNNIIKFENDLYDIDKITYYYEKFLNDITNEHKEYIVDFSNMRTMNSCQITLLVKIVRYLKNNNISLKLENYNKHIDKIFKLINLKEII